MRRLVLTLAALLASCGVARADPVEQPRPLDAGAVDAAVRDSLRAWHVPGAAVAVVRDGQIVYLKGFGVRSVDGTDAVTPDTLFPLGSCSKAFTTAALAFLVDEGKVGWDDPVRKHLPWFRLSDPLADRDVRLRDLLCHRTGLAGHDFLWYRSPWGPEERVRRAGLLPLDRPFRSAFQYQSTMFTAAGLVVGAASGEPWDAFVGKRLFEPLGMTTACCTTRAAEKHADRASGHRLGRGGEAEPMPLYRFDTPDAAGSVHASARDLAKWLIFHLGDGAAGGKRLVSASALAETHTPQMPIPLGDDERELYAQPTQMSTCFGWVVIDYRGQPLVAHSGIIDGFTTQLTMAPRAKLGVVVVCNLHATRFNLAVSDKILDQLLGLPQRDWDARLSAVLRRQDEARREKARAELARRRTDTKPSQPTSAYAGLYENPAYGRLEVAERGGALELRWHALRGPLEHYELDTFALSADDPRFSTRVRFRLSPEGTVAALRLTAIPGTEFVRVEKP